MSTSRSSDVDYIRVATLYGDRTRKTQDMFNYEGLNHRNDYLFLVHIHFPFSLACEMLNRCEYDRLG